MTILALATAAAMAYTATIDTTSNQSILLKTNSDDFASQACMIAASKGLKAVRTFSLESNINYYAVKNKLKCNGQSLTAFAKTYHKLKTEKTRTVSVLANDSTAVSQVCVDALVIGEKDALQKHNLVGKTVRCNNESITKFVQKFAGVQVINNTENTIAQSK